MALSSLNSSGSYRNLVEFCAGRMTMAGDMLYPDSQKGLLYVYEDDFGFIHFCWKNRSTDKVEKKFIIFTKSFQLKRVDQCKTERVYQLEFKWTSESFYYWMQEPNEDRDDEHCDRINEILENPPQNFFTLWYSFVAQSKVNLHWVAQHIFIEPLEQSSKKPSLLQELRLERFLADECVFKYLSTVRILGGHRASLITPAIELNFGSTGLATAEFQSNLLLPLAPEGRDGDAAAQTEFDDMCDDVIIMILSKLDLWDLANIADTNNRLRNIAVPVFCRKYREHVIAFDAFSRSYHRHELRKPYRFQEYKIWKHKPLIRISVANIWFKILRNFGQHIRIIRIQYSQDRSNIYQMKIPYAMWNLMKYVLEYAGDSVEVLDLHSYPFFKLDKPLPKLHTFIAESGCSIGDAALWKHWTTNALELMPNLRSLRLLCVPMEIEKHLSKLERIRLSLKTDEDVDSFISFLHLNPQIAYLDLQCETTVRNHADRMYSAIEAHLTQLKTLKIYHIRAQMPMELIPNYHFAPVVSFKYRNADLVPLIHSFEFNDLKKLEIIYLTDAWVRFIRNIKALNILKLDFGRVKEKERHIRQVVESSELKQIIIKHVTKNENAILKTIFGSEWEEVAVFKEYRIYAADVNKQLFHNVKYQRTLKKNLENSGSNHKKKKNKTKKKEPQQDSANHN